jgi:hypothetical protein
MTITPLLDLLGRDEERSWSGRGVDVPMGGRAAAGECHGERQEQCLHKASRFEGRRPPIVIYSHVGSG